MKNLFFKHVLKALGMAILLPMLPSCVNEKKEVQETVVNFVKAVNDKQDSIIKVIYPDYLDLIPCSSQCDFHNYMNPDSVIVFPLKDKDWDISKKKYGRYYNMDFPQIPEGVSNLYVLHYGTIRFEIVYDGDKAKILRSFNFFSHYNSDLVGYETFGEVVFAYKIRGIYVLDSKNKDYLHHFSDAAKTAVCAWKLLREGTLDSLSYYYPGSDNGIYIRPIIGDINNCVLETSTNSDYTAEFNVAEQDGKNRIIKLYIDGNNNKKYSTPYMITDSKGLYDFSKQISYIEENGEKIKYNLDDVTDQSVYAITDSIIDVINIRSKYIKKGFVVTSFKTVRGSNRHGERTSGVSISVFNPTQKTIKYLSATLVPVNGVGDVMRNITTVKGIGPLKAGQTATWKFEEALYDPNMIVDHFGAILEVTYDDGSKKTLGLGDAKADDNFSTYYWE